MDNYMVKLWECLTVKSSAEGYVDVFLILSCNTFVRCHGVMSRTLPCKSVLQSCIISRRSSSCSSRCLAWNCFVVFNSSFDYKLQTRGTTKKSETWDSFICTTCNDVIFYFCGITVTYYSAATTATLLVQPVWKRSDKPFANKYVKSSTILSTTAFSLWFVHNKPITLFAWSVGTKCNEV